MNEQELEKIVEEKAKKMVEEAEKKSLEPAEETAETAPAEKNMSFSERAKDFVGAVATQKAVQDEKLVDEITEKKKLELKQNADANLKKEQAENKTADTVLQRANYGVYEGVATYAGIKKPLPQKMQVVLFSILSVLQTIFLVIFGIPTSILTIIADCIDVMVKKLSSITKSARWVVLGIVVAGVIYVAFICITAILRNYGIIL